MNRKYSWYLDERASAGRENLDPQHVARYDEKEDADASSELELLKKYGLSNQSVVVEIGAGTGQFTMLAAGTCARVVAVDVSPLMLDRLREKDNRSNLTNVEPVQAGFLSYEHQDSEADFVYSRFALHHIPDFWKSIALKRIRGMLRDGGIFRLWDVIYDFNPSEAEQRIEAWCATAPKGNIEGEWTRADYEEHIRDEHSTYRWLLEPMIERAGLEIVEVEYTPDGMFGKYVLRAI